MSYQPSRCTPREELESRTARLQELMKAKDLDGAIIIQNADLFYFAGTVQRSHLFIPAEGEPVLLVRKNYQRAKCESALKDIRGLTNAKDLFTSLQKYKSKAFITPPMETKWDYVTLDSTFGTAK